MLINYYRNNRDITIIRGFAHLAAEKIDACLPMRVFFSQFYAMTFMLSSFKVTSLLAQRDWMGAFLCMAVGNVALLCTLLPMFFLAWCASAQSGKVMYRAISASVNDVPGETLVDNHALPAPRSSLAHKKIHSRRHNNLPGRRAMHRQPRKQHRTGVSCSESSSSQSNDSGTTGKEIRLSAMAELEDRDDRRLWSSGWS